MVTSALVRRGNRVVCVDIADIRYYDRPICPVCKANMEIVLDSETGKPIFVAKHTDSRCRSFANNLAEKRIHEFDGNLVLNRILSITNTRMPKRRNEINDLYDVHLTGLYLADPEMAVAGGKLIDYLITNAYAYSLLAMGRHIGPRIMKARGVQTDNNRMVICFGCFWVEQRTESICMSRVLTMRFASWEDYSNVKKKLSRIECDEKLFAVRIYYRGTLLVAGNWMPISYPECTRYCAKCSNCTGSWKCTGMHMTDYVRQEQIYVMEDF